MKPFKNWFLRKKAEVEKMIFPKAIDARMLQERTYQLRNGKVLQIEFGNPLDVESIIAIQKACYGGKSPWGRLIVYNELQNRNSFFLVASDYGEPIAFIGVALKKDYLHITNIATKPTYQKQGIASFFIDTVTEIGQEIERSAIRLEVRVSNEGAIRLYRKLGFEDVYVKKQYYKDNNEDALEMALKIRENG